MSLKSAANETSPTKTLLPMAKRLYWNANGEIHLLQWIDDLNQAAKAEFCFTLSAFKLVAFPRVDCKVPSPLFLYMTRWTTILIEKCSRLACA